MICKGPEIRLKTFENGKEKLITGQKFSLVCSKTEKKGTSEYAAISYPELCNQVVQGNTILIDDGKVELVVDEVEHCDITGNVVSIVDGTTDLDEAAEMIVRSKSFDHATSCSTENNIIVLEECYDAWVAAMEKAGAVLIKEGTAEKDALLKTLWPESPANHNLNRQIVAQGAEAIAKAAGIDVPAGTKMLMAEENGGYGNDYPFTGEKLSPVSGIRKAKDFDDAVDKMMKILDYQGKGHSCGIHTSLPERVTKLGEVIPVCKVCVNQPQSLTNSGSWTCGFPISMTLGCGTWGHNSISHNATWKDLLNFTYVSRPIPSFQPTDEDLFDAAIREKVDA